MSLLRNHFLHLSSVNGSATNNKFISLTTTQQSSPERTTPASLHIVLDLALPQGLIESVAQGQVVLVLGTGQELLQLVATRRLVLVLLWGWGVLLLDRSCLLLLHLLVLITAAEHASHRVSDGVALIIRKDNFI